MKANVEISPFLPGTNIQYAWDSTSIGYGKRCPRLYQYVMIDGYEEKEVSIHLRFGIEYHAALRDYEELVAGTAGYSWSFTHNEAVQYAVYNLLQRIADWEPDRDSKAGKKKNPETLLRTVVWYLDEHEHDEAKTLIWPDGSPAVEQSFRFELDWGPRVSRMVLGCEVTEESEQPYVISGHLDKIVSYGGQHFVLDHKTTTWWLGPKYFEMYEPENQMTLYTLASKVVLGDHAVRGVIIDAAKIDEEKTTFARGITYRTPDQLEEWVYDLKIFFEEMEGYAKKGYWPMRDTSCDKYGGCKFREVCSQSRGVRQRLLDGNFIKLTEKEKWNPLRKR